jgi:PAS domain S-box-containing protein
LKHQTAPPHLNASPQAHETSQSEGAQEKTRSTLPLAQTLAGRLPPLGARLPLVASIIMGALALVAGWLGLLDLAPFLILVVVTALVHLAGAALVRRGLWVEVVNPALRLFNLGMLTLAVLLYEGLHSPLILLYVEEIVSASLRDGRRGARKGWGLVTTALVIVALCSWPLTWSLGLHGLAYVSVLGVIALIVGEMGQQRIEIQAALAQQTLENTRLLQRVQDHADDLSALAADLAWEKSKLDAILRNIADGLIVTDLEGTILLVNPAFESLFGQPAASLLGRPLAQAVNVPTLQRLIAGAPHAQSTVQEADLSLPGGRTIRASSSAIREATYVLGVVTVLRDITHQVELDRVKTDFIAVVSHELRTPLTSVLGFAKLIQRSFERHISPQVASDDPKSQRAIQRIGDNLNIIVSEGERLTRLINDVLDIAKMEAGKIDWHPSAVSLADIVHSAVATATALAQAKRLELKVEVQEELPPLWADRDRMAQVMTNLLSNAIKFTDSGQVYVRAYQLRPAPDEMHASRLEPGDWLIVSVQDTGIGIAPEHFSQVFKKFKQVPDTTAGRKGTGLGLPISKEIIEHHGGRIWLESKPGVGSTFTCVLPAKEM